MVADLWQRKGKISGSFKYSASVVLQQSQTEVSFQRKASSVLLKFFALSFKGLTVLSFHKKALSTFFKNCSENFNAMLEPFL